MLSLTYFVIVVLGGAFAVNVGRLVQGHIYVSVSNWDIPLLLAVPTYLALINLLLLRLFDRASDKSVTTTIKIATTFAIVAILARPIYGYFVTTKMEYSGYTSCWPYSSPSLMSPTVWVKQPGYCVSNSGKVRKEILSWMDTLPNRGSDIPVNAVNEKVSMLLEDWEKNEIKRYPHLYDEGK
jgi:hypothetical protein